MKRSLDGLDLVSFALMAAAVIGTAVVFERLPDPLPVHFDLGGHPNGWMPRTRGALLVPATMIVLWLLVRVGPHLAASPSAEKRETLEHTPLSLIALVLVTLLAGAQGFVLHASLQASPRLDDGIWALLGGSSLVLGLVMPRLPRNRWIGVRTPWTLASEENWAQTHRFAGLSMILGGGAMVVMTMAGVPLVGVVFLLLGAMAPVVHSARLARGSRSE